MKSFKHIDAKTVKEACELLKEYQGRAKIIAGGTDLLGVLKDRIHPNYPEVIINLKTISNLNYIREGSNGLKIGALTTLSQIASSPLIKENYKVLAEAAYSVATIQIRNMATIGGNLCQEVRCWYYRYPHAIGGRLLCLRKGSGSCQALSGDNRYHAIFGGKGCFAVCPSDIAGALTALNASIRIEGPKKQRTVSVKEFFSVLGNVLRPDELVTEIQIPKPTDKTRQTFLKFTLRKPIDFAIVSVATLLWLEDNICKDACMVLGAVAPFPWRVEKAEEALRGRPIDPKTIEEALEAAVVGAKPLDKNAYKIEIVKALLKRAISI